MQRLPESIHIISVALPTVKVVEKKSFSSVSGQFSWLNGWATWLCAVYCLQEISWNCSSIHPSSPFLLHSGSQGSWSLSQLSWGEGKVTTWTCHQFIAGPHRKTNNRLTHRPSGGLWEEAAVPREKPPKAPGEHVKSTQKVQRNQTHHFLAAGQQC